MLEVKQNERGFACAEFIDRYGFQCSIQDSSIATEACIWLGQDQVRGEPARAHLTIEMVRQLLPLLHNFVACGTIAESAPVRDLREQLAALVHEQWSNWRQSVYQTARYGPGGITMSDEFAERWIKESIIKWYKLPEDQKGEWLEEADAILSLVDLRLIEAERAAGVLQEEREQAEERIDRYRKALEEIDRAPFGLCGDDIGVGACEHCCDIHEITERLLRLEGANK